MSTLTCPKCRQGITDDALDLGQCALCGFPLDGPVVLGTPGGRAGQPRWGLIATVVLLLGAGGGVVYGFLDTPDANTTQPAVEVAAVPAEESPPVVSVIDTAPFPHEPKRAADTPNPAPVPV